MLPALWSTVCLAVEIEHNTCRRRRKARHYGLQALYHGPFGASPDIEAEFRVDNDFTHTDAEYFMLY